MSFTREIHDRIRQRAEDWADNYTEKPHHNKMISGMYGFRDGIVEVLNKPFDYDLIPANTEERGLIELALEEHINVLKNRFEDESGYVHPAKQYEELLEKYKKLNNENIGG